MVNETSKLMNCTCITPNGSLVNRNGKGSISNKTSTVKNCMGMMQVGMMGNNMTAKVNETGKANNTSQGMNNMKM